jgi:hypothetical protein
MFSSFTIAASCAVIQDSLIYCPGLLYFWSFNNVENILKHQNEARYRWLMTIILAISRQRSGGSRFEASLGK